MSLGANGKLLLITLLNLAVTIALSRPLAATFGVAGLALSTSIMYAVATAAILLFGARLLNTRIEGWQAAGGIPRDERLRVVPCIPVLE
jgi:O-antigen/teichoic acid export membrane protein